MGDNFLLGIDAGTSLVKAAIFDDTGKECAAAARRTSVLIPRPGWAEMDMESVWQATAATIREVLSICALDGSAVAAVGVSGQMIGAWPVDRNGRPFRNAILWNDGRTQDLIQRLEERQPGVLQQIFALSGCVMQHGCTMPLVAWLARHEPESLERAGRVLTCKDWVRFRLTGELYADQTEAAVLPGNTYTQSYADELFELLELESQRRLFSPVLPSEAIAGHVTAQAALETGLRRGTPVVAGLGDVPAVALGAGAIEPGMACTILGTTCINGLVLEQPGFEPLNVGLLFFLPGRRWLRVFANIAGTTNLDWFIERFYGAESAAAPSRAALFSALEELAATSPPGSQGVIYHPYLSSVGIIAPVVAPQARAQFFGLSYEHRREDLLRAIYEGVALSIRDCYSMVEHPLRDIRLSGGGARSGFWCQLIADCTGRQLAVPAGQELGARGAALLAGVGIGWYVSIPAAVGATVQVARTYTPDQQRQVYYDELYAAYREIRQLIQPAWQRRSSLPGAI